MKFYGKNYKFIHNKGTNATLFEIIDDDTFTVASRESSPCCLSFASHKRPGGGYTCVMDIPHPIRTQEEDLFRRSNLPEIMDVSEVRDRYPLKGIEGFYCEATVFKDAYLSDVEPFTVGVVTIPAVINPTRRDEHLIKGKIKRILDISASNKHKVLILGAWGCGIFNNDPKMISSFFMHFLTSEFKGIFEKVIFAIPGAGHPNFKAFADTILEFDP